jgi:hypothetical protein
LSGTSFQLLQRKAKDAKYNDPQLAQDGFEGALITDHLGARYIAPITLRRNQQSLICRWPFHLVLPLRFISSIASHVQFGIVVSFTLVFCGQTFIMTFRISLMSVML